MMKANRATAAIAAVLMLTATGCEEGESERLVDMAERHLERQAEQTRRVTELQRQVAEGSRRLVEADAAAREAFVELHRDVQTERTEVGRQRDLLEAERRQQAARRHRDPVIAAAILKVGALLACLLPLLVCWLLLARRVEPADDEEVAELLLEDLVSKQPLLLPKGNEPRSLDWDEAPADAGGLRGESK